MVAPGLSGHVPEPLGKGQVSYGLAGAGATALKGDDDFTPGLEGDFWMDLGVSDRLDLRVRATLMTVIDTDDDGNDNIWGFGPSLEYKLSSASGRAALVTGLSLLFFIGRYEDNTGENSGGLYLAHVSFAPSLGAVFALGDPGNIRLLIAPRVSAGITARVMQLAFSAGLDIPLADKSSLRPEIISTCTIPYEEFSFVICYLGGGMAYVF